MFSGIVTDVGEIIGIDKESADIIISIKSNLDLSSIKLGHSISCDGICLTVIKNDLRFISVQISDETKRLTNSKFWKVGYMLNLENSLKIGDELHGHFVSGHVDCTTKVMKKENIGDSWVFQFVIPGNLKKLIAKKGSIVINGVSLTVNEVNDQFFEVNIIPYTFNHTNFQNLDVGSIVNIEVDLIARYVARQLDQ